MTVLSSEQAQFALLAFSSLFTVINPVEAAPIFVAMTAGSPESRRRSAVRACVSAGAILAVFAIAGGAIFSFFGITVPAFQIAGGILFTLMAIGNLRNGEKRVPAGEDTADPSVVPLGIPVIAGPGAISTVMVLVGQAPDPVKRLALGAAIALNVVLTLAILLAAPRVVSRIGLTGERIVSKIMGLITVVIGIQFVINGVTTVMVEILRANRG
jgi:multiple antibiotic resistance protein